MEQRIHELEGELDNEQRRGQDASKNLAKQDRRLRELQFQVIVDFYQIKFCFIFRWMRTKNQWTD